MVGSRRKDGARPRAQSDLQPKAYSIKLSDEHTPARSSQHFSARQNTVRSRANSYGSQGQGTPDHAAKEKEQSGQGSVRLAAQTTAYVWPLSTCFSRCKASIVFYLLGTARNTNKVSEGTKPGQVRRNSLVATSGRASRLPSIPFSMTTRRGAKTASAGPSSASSGSRRSSLNDDDEAQFQEAASDFELERPAKRSRTSTESQLSNGPFDNKPMNGMQGEDAQKPAPDATTTLPTTAGKKRRASDDSTQSSKTINPRPNGVLTRTQSEVSEQQPRRKKRKTTRAPTESADQPPELTDASTAPNSPEQLPDVDGSQNLQNVLPTNGDAPAKPGRRLPGRRRQPHSDINIETDLRRQLTLKMNYRSLAKVQKTLLEELSKRTIENLEKDDDYHTRCPEYEPLMAELKQRRDGRIDQIDAVRTYRMEQMQRVRLAEERIQKEQYIVSRRNPKKYYRADSLEPFSRFAR